MWSGKAIAISSSPAFITGYDWSLSMNNVGEFVFFKSPPTDGLMSMEEFMSMDHQYKDNWVVKAILKHYKNEK